MTTQATPPLQRRLLAELLGSAFLAALDDLDAKPNRAVTKAAKRYKRRSE